MKVSEKSESHLLGKFKKLNLLPVFIKRWGWGGVMGGDGVGGFELWLGFFYCSRSKLYYWWAAFIYLINLFVILIRQQTVSLQMANYQLAWYYTFLIHAGPILYITDMGLGICVGTLFDEKDILFACNPKQMSFLTISYENIYLFNLRAVDCVQ